MRNSSAIAQLIVAAETADDPLDRLACRRAAAWLRWCDGYGATLTAPEAARIAAGGRLAEVARGLLRRLAETYPGPVEDARLDYLEEGEGCDWSLGGIGSDVTLRPPPPRSLTERVHERVNDPFRIEDPVVADDLPGLTR